jgi:hypothetical protein
LCEEESCSRATFRTALASEVVPHFQDYDDGEAIGTIENVLWRSGVIAYTERATPARWRFAWSAGEVTQGRLSPAATQIGFHSCMIDVCGIKATQDGPIF